ncbi:MAG: DNA-3-methyladenine glycosylase [Chlorobi bacterium]|nr:DNA-3-methyladenine glycosylase [Chlorobiota bacterium]
MLEASFFKRDTRTVARELLGKYLYRRTPDGRLFRGIISETEAYHGPEDLACHCAKGKTPRTTVMFGPGGHIYVYLIYGMYEMLNFTTMDEGFPAAVLIRGLMHPEVWENGRFVPLDAKTDGPGKLTRAFEIDRSLNTRPLGDRTGLWVEDAGITPREVETTPRIGVDYAGEWKDKPWRYVIKKL